MSAAAGALAVLSSLVCLVAAIGVVRARRAADALHFTAPVVVLGGPLLLLALTLDSLGGAFLAQAWMTFAVVLLAAPIVAHATARMLRRRGDR